VSCTHRLLVLQGRDLFGRVVDRRQRRANAWKRLLGVGLLFLTAALLRTQPSQAASEFAAGATFTRVTTGDLVTAQAYHWAGSWGDYDDDGWLDVFVGTNVEWQRNFLYHNNRDGTFTLIDEAAMPKSPSNQHGSAWADYDNDGDLDLIGIPPRPTRSSTERGASPSSGG
jgi:hypothetical protein